METIITNKFYVPEISEFYVGFEFEVNGMDCNWAQTGFENQVIRPTKDDYFDLFTLGWVQKVYYKPDIPLEQFIRVKYLDSEDIESLGFKITFDDVGITYWRLNNYEIQTDVDLGSYIEGNNLYSIYYFPYDKQKNCVFSGKIKNKSELKQVLKMIGVQ